jgi:hypothetical protein
VFSLKKENSLPYVTMNSFNGIEEENERGHGKKGSQLRMMILTAKGVQAIHRK